MPGRPFAPKDCRLTSSSFPMLVFPMISGLVIQQHKRPSRSWIRVFTRMPGCVASIAHDGRPRPSLAAKQKQAGKTTRFRIQNQMGYGNMAMFTTASTSRNTPVSFVGLGMLITSVNRISSLPGCTLTSPSCPCFSMLVAFCRIDLLICQPEALYIERVPWWWHNLRERG